MFTVSVIFGMRLGVRLRVNIRVPRFSSWSKIVDIDSPKVRQVYGSTLTPTVCAMVQSGLKVKVRVKVRGWDKGKGWNKNLGQGLQVDFTDQSLKVPHVTLKRTLSLELH